MDYIHNRFQEYICIQNIRNQKNKQRKIFKNSIVNRKRLTNAYYIIENI